MGIASRTQPQIHLSSPIDLARRDEHEHELRCTLVETAQGSLCRQALQSRAWEAEDGDAETAYFLGTEQGVGLGWGV